MTIRTTTTTVSFDSGFSVKATGESYPAGSYEVRTDEEAIDSMTVVAWRRVATAILVKASGVTQAVSIDPAELDALIGSNADAARVRGATEERRMS